MSRHVRASAIVSVTVDVRLDAAWGGDCPTKQVVDQGTFQAINAVHKLLAADPRMQHIRMSSVEVRIVEEER